MPRKKKELKYPEDFVKSNAISLFLNSDITNLCKGVKELGTVAQSGDMVVCVEALSGKLLICRITHISKKPVCKGC